MAEYLTYPFRTMRITQNYNGSTSHYGHSHGAPKDYPIDEGGSDGGRDPIYAPCKLIIRRIWGVGTDGVNTLFCESANKVKLANGKTDYVSFQITHPNDSDLRRLKVWQTIAKGAVLCYEGTDGASGNHIHLSVGRGKLSGNGWVKNSRGKWVLTTTGGTLKPEAAFFVDPKFTKIVNNGGINFKQMPAAKKAAKNAKYAPGVYRVTTNLLYVRSGAGTDNPKLPFTYLTADARAQILKLNGGKYADGFVRGVLFTVNETDGSWGKCPSGWVCLDYCEVAK